MDQLFHKTLGTMKVSTDRRENRDLTVTEQVDTDRTWPEKTEDAQNALKSRLCESGPYEMVPWL